jgi:3-hydroxyisobutyrate dehydrogenase-like beta-hydroxyacid dehydrogenase
MTRVGAIGVGEIGGAFVERMLEAGMAVSVFARRADVRERFVSLGAASADSIAELARSVDVLNVCVFTDEQVREVCSGRDGALANLRAGSTLVTHTTGSPRTVEALAAMRSDVAVIDAPVSGSPAQARAGTIALLVGGADEAVQGVRPLMETYAHPVLHVGPIGSGQKVKLVNNLLFAGNVQLALGARTVAEQLGLDGQAVMTALAHCSGASFGAQLAAMASVTEVTTMLKPFLGKDIGVVQAVAAELGVDLAELGRLVAEGPFVTP